MSQNVINLAEFQGLTKNEISLVKLYWKLYEKKRIEFTCLDPEPLTNKGLAIIMKMFIKDHPEYDERR
ncbi:hypothetical protein [Clostridium sp. UBA1652]|uniref:hypothetical protein n=1 Tax=Clostridium sp. UBA1652 TaxID=1946348 RepID=UPI00257C9B4F|nr:hypothetical protein [Clostridium sp. UBA1652]